MIFTPNPNEGAKYPKHENKICNGHDLRNIKNQNSLQLKWLISAYQNTKDKSLFFNDFFTKLSGTQLLQQQIENGISEKEIRKTWEKGLNKYEALRKPYLLY